MGCVGSPCLQARGSEGSQVAEMLMLRPLLYQGPTEGVGWGGLQHKEECTDGSAARQTDTSWGSLRVPHHVASGRTADACLHLSLAPRIWKQRPRSCPRLTWTQSPCWRSLGRAWMTWLSTHSPSSLQPTSRSRPAIHTAGGPSDTRCSTMTTRPTARYLVLLWFLVAPATPRTRICAVVQWEQGRGRVTTASAVSWVPAGPSVLISPGCPGCVEHHLEVHG